MVAYLDRPIFKAPVTHSLPVIYQPLFNMSSNQTSPPKGSGNQTSRTSSAPAGGNKAAEKSSAQDSGGQTSQSDGTGTENVPSLDRKTIHNLGFTKEDKS